MCSVQALARHCLIVKKRSLVQTLLLSQRESLVTVKFFDPKISMIFDISELPESKYAFSSKCMCLCVHACARAYVRACLGACVRACEYVCFFSGGG